MTGLWDEHLKVLMMGGWLLIAEVDWVSQLVTISTLGELRKVVSKSIPILFTHVSRTFDIESLIALDVVELIGIQIEVFCKLVDDAEPALFMNID